MKRIITFIVIGLMFFLVVGCGTTTDTTDEVKDSTDAIEEDMEISKDLIGTWEATSDDMTITLKFNDDGTYEETKVSGDVTDTIEGVYTEYEGDLTLNPTTLNGMDEEDYLANNEVSEELMNNDDYAYNVTEATITIDGDMMTYKAGDTTLEFTKKSE